MALAKAASQTRADYGAVTKTPQTRGLVLNGQQVEEILVTKLTGDTSGSIDLSNIRRPRAVYVQPTRDNLGNNVADLTITEATFTHTDADTIALSGLGNWTVAILKVAGRSYQFSATA